MMQNPASTEDDSQPQSTPLDDTNKMLRPEITLIVAATSKLGIGRDGTLPWTGLKKEMAYFARVTKKRFPYQTGPNAVIMGRKTWESIPEKWRPLKERLNIVITRDMLPDSAAKFEGAERADSISSALKSLEEKNSPRRVFVIGGAQIYKAAIELQDAKRVLLTRVLSEFSCDTFFPVYLSKTEGWERRTHEELCAWVGENVPVEDQQENGTKYRFEMWERMEGWLPWNEYRAARSESAW